VREFRSVGRGQFEQQPKKSKRPACDYGESRLERREIVGLLGVLTRFDGHGISKVKPRMVVFAAMHCLGIAVVVGQGLILEVSGLGMRRRWSPPT
jgi:hypothetical protein